MQIQLIRSATIRLNYAQKSFIIDPYLAAKFTRPSYTGKSPNPLVELPCTPLEAIAGIEMALISHLHSDHFDPAAHELLPKDLSIYCQPQDQATIESKGFHNVIPVTDTLTWQEISITRTACQHGSGAVLKDMGDASGFVLSAKNEPTIYWAGDTIWNEAVAGVIERTQPDIIITHSCGATWGDHVLIVMDAEQTLAVCRAAPNSTVIATHMEALDHATITREDLRRYADANGIGPERLLIPLDGEKITF
ncbi:MAG: Zn-dependent hydrolase [Chloroflexi bacterium HGW-Chloroflexi-10]|nr:MAG: Zn-dependent hydrolase [Chloroflexi bacterium HGW-Chloroflexi-10]